jgi:WD40 repeat protein
MAAHEKVPYVMTLKINDIVQCPGRCALTWTNDGLLLTAGETATVSVVRPGESKKYLNDLTNGDGIVTIAAHTTNNSNNHDATVDRSNETKTCPSKFIMGCITGNVYLSDTNGKKSVFVTHCELAIRYVSYSPNCKTIAVCSDDGVVRLLNSDDFKVAYDIEDHDGPVLSMAWSPNGDKLASLGDDGTLMIWSTLGK